MNKIAPLLQTLPDSLTPSAKVQGLAISLPKDLYIPPDAMEVFLEAFEGPLDLLLYLIKKQNIDILDIPIAEVTRQYMHYVDIMKAISLALAGDYLVMAALLAEIKSRILLPQLESIAAEEEDPRADLIRRLQEYERFKNAAEQLDNLPRDGRDTFGVTATIDDSMFVKALPSADITDLIGAFRALLQRTAHHQSHHIQLEALSVRERMTAILSHLQDKSFITFTSAFNVQEGRLGVVVSFLAILELLKDHIIEFIQATPFGPIHLKAAGK